MIELERGATGIMVTKLATNNESGLTFVGAYQGAVPSGPAVLFA